MTITIGPALVDAVRLLAGIAIASPVVAYLLVKAARGLGLGAGPCSTGR